MNYELSVSCGGEKVEILGNKLKRFFDKVDNPPNDADISYAGNRYEVWEVSEDLFNKMCDMSEDEFVKLAGEEAWWRQSDGSVLGVPDTYFSVHGERLLGWDSPIYESKTWHKYVNLSEYLCDCIGASTGKNVCACVTDLAKYNDMTIAELFDKYEGYPEKESYKNKIINDTEIEDILAEHFNVSDCLLKVVHTIHGESVVAEIVE